MNSAPISPGISAIFSALLSDSNPESPGGGPSATVSGVDFGELLNNQQDAGKLMQRLEKLLPPQDFERLKLAIEDGKSLPQAVTIAVGQLPDAGHWEPDSPTPVALKVQQQPFDTGEPQPLINNPFAGSPDTLPVDATSGPFVQHPKVPLLVSETGMVSTPNTTIPPASSVGAVTKPLAAPEGLEQTIRGHSIAVPQPVIKLPSSTVVGPSDPPQVVIAGKTFPGPVAPGETTQPVSVPAGDDPNRGGYNASVALPPSATNLQPAMTVNGSTHIPQNKASFSNAPSAANGQFIPNIRVPVSGMVQQPLAGDQAVQTNSATDPEGIAAGLNRFLQQTQVSVPDGARVPASSPPDVVSRTPVAEPVANGRIPPGENLHPPSRVEPASVMLPATAVVPASPISTPEPAAAVSGIARFIQQLSVSDQNRVQSVPASSDKPAQIMGGEAVNAVRIPVAEHLFSPDRAGSVAPSQPVQGLTVPVNGITSDPMQGVGALARMLTQPAVSDEPPVSMPKVAAGTTPPSPALVSQTVIDAGRATPTLPVTDNLIQPVKQDLAAVQQFSTLISTATVAVDQGSQASAAAAISVGMGGVVPQTGGSLLQPGGSVNLNLAAPLGTRDWGEAVGERILWMVGRTIQGATLRVTPPHLGSIDIQVTMHQDQTNVSFTTQNGAVREALEAAIPRLREMFGESNLQLANVDVSQRQAEDQRGMFGNEGRDKGNGPDVGDDTQRGMSDTENESSPPGHESGPNTDQLLDYYA